MKRRRIPRQSDNRAFYREAFIREVHLLLYMGYARLQRRRFAHSSEPDISGALCEAIEKVLEDPDSDDWVENFEIHDDPPVHSSRRTGKRRRRVDIKFVSRIARPRLRFCFEAKLLGAKNNAGKYFGADGLGRFLDGSYAAGEETAGMLGYVQSLDCDCWADKLKRGINGKLHRLSRNGNWTEIAVCAQLSHTFRTVHSRRGNLSPIIVYHTLLAFTG